MSFLLLLFFRLVKLPEAHEGVYELCFCLSYSRHDFGSMKICCSAHPDAPLIEDYRAGDQICSECGLVVGDRYTLVPFFISLPFSYKFLINASLFVNVTVNETSWCFLFP